MPLKLRLELWDLCWVAASLVMVWALVSVTTTRVCCPCSTFIAWDIMAWDIMAWGIIAWGIMGEFINAMEMTAAAHLGALVARMR